MFRMLWFWVCIVFPSVCMAGSGITGGKEDVRLSDMDAVWKKKGQVEGAILRTTFPDRRFDIVRYGAQNGKDASEAIRKAISDCHEQGGGMVVIPEGVFYTGPIHLLSDVNLHLEEGAVLKFSTDPADYFPAVATRWEGVDCMA